jgi:hypothetical protein
MNMPQRIVMSPMWHCRTPATARPSSYFDGEGDTSKGDKP